MAWNSLVYRAVGARRTSSCIKGAAGLLGALLVGAPARATEAPGRDVRGAESAPHVAPTAARQRLEVQLGFVRYLSAKYVGGGKALGVGYRASLAEPLQVGGGVRLVAGPLVAGSAAAEVFASCALEASFGSWTPRLSLELGYSGVLRAKPRSYDVPVGSDVFYRDTPSPIYFAIAAAPLSFGLGRAHLSLLEIDWGSSVPDFGRGIRLAVWFANAQWSL